MKENITIGWLYPELMSTYGDRGNIFVLEKRCLSRSIGIKFNVITFDTNTKIIQSCSLIFGGGAQDRQQKLLIEDLRIKKGPILKKMFDKGIPGLFVCGAPQLLGNTYMTGDGTTLQGLGIFDMESKHFGKDKPRCIGNTVGELSDSFLKGCPSTGSGRQRKTVVGFENHGGRTYLKSGLKSFSKVLVGCGNNGDDGTEGAVYRNCIATYSHGPFLPKNPHIADWLIAKALEVKYKKAVSLEPLDDTLEWQAHDYVVKRFLGRQKSNG